MYRDTYVSQTNERKTWLVLKVSVTFDSEIEIKEVNFGSSRKTVEPNASYGIQILYNKKMQRNKS